MDVDLFLEFASPPGSDPGAIFEDNLALVRAADAAGFAAAWVAEHHFLGDYSNAACPEMLLAAMARETRAIGLGFGIVPLPIHDPVRVAERLATLDLLSGARVLWGIGRGVTPTELAAFGIPPGEARARMVTNLHALRDLLQTGLWRRDGQCYALRPMPRPALSQGWLAAVSAESFDLAAELGLDVLTGPFKPWPLVAWDLRRYRALRPDGRTSFTLALFCDEDRARARALAERGLLWAFRRLMDLSGPVVRGQLEGYAPYRRFGWIMPLLENTLSLPVLETLGLAVVGTPEDCARRLEALAASGLDRVSLVLGGGDIARADLLRCIGLLGAHVLPRLARASAPACAMPA